jgi:hypothetical protein
MLIRLDLLWINWHQVTFFFKLFTWTVISTILQFLAVASAVGDWTGWSGCVMRKKLKLHIAFGSFSETIPAGTFIHLTVLTL